MSEYINKREAFEEMFLRANPFVKQDLVKPCAVWNAAATIIRTMKSSDVTPVIHSKWVQVNNTQNYYCFQCGSEFDFISCSKDKYIFCPFCGAKMDLNG